MNSSEKKRSNSIDIFRYVCALMVVVIHTTPFSDSIPLLSRALVDGLARIAVPFFFAVAGYGFGSHLNKSVTIKDKFTVLGKSVSKQLLVYGIWSVIYLLVDIWAVHDENPDWGRFAVKFITDFLIFGSSFQFWFFPALFFAMVCFTIAGCIKKGTKLLWMISVPLAFLGCLSSAYRNVVCEIGFFKWMFELPYFTYICRWLFYSLPYFAVGNIVFSIIDNCSQSESNSCINKPGILLFGLVITLSLSVIEKVVVFSLKTGDDMVLTLFQIPFCGFLLIHLLSYRMIGLDKAGSCFRFVSLFVYCSHPLIMILYKKVVAIFDLKSMSNTIWMWLIVSLISSIGGVVLWGLTKLRVSHQLSVHNSSV